MGLLMSEKKTILKVPDTYKGLLEDVLVRQTDRRRSRRYKMGYPFLFTILATKTKERGYIKNISKHGISFLTSYNLTENEEIRAEIYISDQIFKVVGRIVYKHDSSMYNMYEVGVDFGEIIDEFKDKLEENLRGMFQGK